ITYNIPCSLTDCCLATLVSAFPVNWGSLYFFDILLSKGQWSKAQCHHVDLFCNCSSTFFIWLVIYFVDHRGIYKDRGLNWLKLVYVYLNMHMRPFFSLLGKFGS
ncbi:hypothetical protein ACJX0J_019859, partial [Zea mays]